MRSSTSASETRSRAPEALAVVCVWTKGPKFGPEYVFALARGISRGFPGRVVQVVRRGSDPGYWAKLELFRPGAFPAGTRVFYLDLDSVVVGSLDFVADLPLDPGRIYLIPSISNVEGRWNSGAMLWRAGDLDDLWEKRPKDQAAQRHYPAGDQQYIYQTLPPSRIRPFPPKKFLSYKRHVLNNPQGVHPDCAVVCFHGHPMPHELRADHPLRKTWESP